MPNRETDFQKALAKLADGKDLTRETSAMAMRDLLTSQPQEIPDSQIAAFIMGLHTKGETISEIAGFLDAIVEVGDKVKLKNSKTALDTCGTGGDGRMTFNISTIAGLLVASAGVKVAKHGNVSVSSTSGSADLLDALGVNIHLCPEGVAKCIKKIGFGFCFARYFHPAFGRVAKVRQELKQKTVFNVLGPLSNPANVGRQILGVSDPELCELIADVLLERGVFRAMVVYGLSPDGGMDEISSYDKTQVVEIQNGEKVKYEIDPQKFGIKPPAGLKNLQVKSVEDALLAAKEVIINSKPGPKRDITALNAGAALYISKKADTIKDGYEMAQDLLETGALAKLVEELVTYSNALNVKYRHKNAP